MSDCILNVVQQGYRLHLSSLTAGHERCTLRCGIDEIVQPMLLRLTCEQFRAQVLATWGPGGPRTLPGTTPKKVDDDRYDPSKVRRVDKCLHCARVGPCECPAGTPKVSVPEDRYDEAAGMDGRIRLGRLAAPIDEPGWLPEG